MKTTTSLHIENGYDQTDSPVASKKGKNLYLIILEAMIRKTSSDKRMAFFGSDPLK
jgi:hypothetical protein